MRKPREIFETTKKLCKELKKKKEMTKDDLKEFAENEKVTDISVSLGTLKMYSVLDEVNNAYVFKSDVAFWLGTGHIK